MARYDTCPTCGQRKDRRAVECASCGRSRKALRQWSDSGTRNRIVEGICRARRAMRRTFDKITIDTRWMFKRDGRAFTYYWDGDRKRYIYRYQWVWIQANGPIPDGCVIHHRNHDCTDDRLENLEAMLIHEHIDHHESDRSRLALEARGIAPLTDAERHRVCETCGGSFAIKCRGKSNRFCSLPCYHQSMRAS